MKSLDWIKSLVESELRMEETGMIDLAEMPDETKDVLQKTSEFLREIKEEFIECTTAFNQFKNSTLGNIKIYGISNTAADFMLFRNGYKLLFSTPQPGRITVSFQNQAPQFLPGASASPSSAEEFLEAMYGPFDEITWTYRGTPVKVPNLVRYYLSRFVRESAK